MFKGKVIHNIPKYVQVSNVGGKYSFSSGQHLYSMYIQLQKNKCKSTYYIPYYTHCKQLYDNIFNYT